jgi:hypothetical protein
MVSATSGLSEDPHDRLSLSFLISRGPHPGALSRHRSTGSDFFNGLLGLILGADVRAQSITESSEAHYRPSVDEHRFGLLTDRIISPRDSRFLLEEERGEATIEFYLTRSWPERDDLNNLYCIFYIGGRKAHGRPQSASLDDKAGGGGAPAPGELIDPYAEPTHVIPRAKASGGSCRFRSSLLASYCSLCEQQLVLRA